MPENKLVASIHFDEEDRLVVKINDEEVRRTAVRNHGVYKFNYQKEEYYFIYEEGKETNRVFFYPFMDVFEERVLTITKEE